MDLQQLHYFQTVARLQHVTKAAELLRIAQPSLSRSIATLENELGTPLFERKGRNIVLNEQGRIFLHYVETAFDSLEQGKRHVASFSHHEQNELTLVVTSASQLLPTLLSRIHTEQPNVHFKLLQHLPSEVAHSHQQSFDFCISSTIPNIHNIESTVLLVEPLLLAVPRHHRLATQKQIALHEVAQDAFICLQQGKELRHLTDALCQQAGFTPRIAYESDDPATVRGLISAGLGVALVPAHSWKNHSEKNVMLVSVSHPTCVRTLYLSWIQRQTETQFQTICRNNIVSFFHTLITHTSR